MWLRTQYEVISELYQGKCVCRFYFALCKWLHQAVWVAAWEIVEADAVISKEYAGSTD